MADRHHEPIQQTDAANPPEEFVAGGSQWHPLTTAAVVGGAIAATAGAYLGTRALARRNGAKGRVNQVMAAAMTACDMGNKATAEADPAIIPVPPTID